MLASKISFTTPENNKQIPINIRDLSSIPFKKISELDLYWLENFSQEKTSSFNEKFQPLRYKDSNLYLEINKDAIVLEFD